MPWTNQQKAVIKSYQRYAGISDAEYRSILHTYAGATSSRDPHLTQWHFDTIMPAIEVRAHLAETNGLTRGRRPAKLTDWYYWRNRAPGKGRATTRELWKIGKLWQQLCPYLPEADRTHTYQCGIASHAVGRKIQHLHDLSLPQALAVIEALKDRLAHAMRRPA